jgi:tripartite-type tricarboxylate transporter receptor subunit TctC
MRSESPLDRSLWRIALTIAVIAVVASFAYQPLFSGDDEASGFSHPLTLWVAGGETGGQAEAVARQAAACWQFGGRSVTVGTLPGGSATAVADFLDRVHRAPDELLLVTSTTLSDIAHDVQDTSAPELRERAQRAARLLDGAAPVALLGGDSLTLTVRAGSPIRSTAQLLALMRTLPSRPLVGVAEDTWLQGNLAALAQSAGVHGAMPFSVFRSSREAVVSLDAGEAEVVVAPYSVVSGDLRDGRLRELPWPARRDATPRAWVAILAPLGLDAGELATLRHQARELCPGGAWQRLLRVDGLTPIQPGRASVANFMHDGVNEATRLQTLAARIVRDY